MTKNKLLSCVIGVIILSLLVGAYFYQRNKVAVHQQAERLFVQMLQEEIERKERNLNLFHLFSESSSDTLPLKICIITEEGKKEYEVDSLKSKKNISQNLRNRSIHSILCEKSHLLPDSLNEHWQSMLKKDHIDTESTIHVRVENLQGKIISSSSHDGVWDTSSGIITSYIGNRCEIEVIGLLAFSWKTILWYHWQPFGWIVICLLLMLLFICFYYKMVNRPPELKEVPYEVVVEKEVVAEKEVIREIIVEKETSPEKKAPLIKQICKVEGQLYGLRYGVVFDAQNRVLNCNGKKMSLSPQQCQILKLFLDAPDYTVTDEDIIKFIWKGQSNVQINTFCSAGNKLGKRLEQAGCGVCFRRFGSDRYRMLFIDDLVDNDLT
ncbi:winged helix-turn-helix domain-containing protein [Bacteroides fragilis]|uniref:winged helix-turn-helix domain-containing protein n=1 Tax=Bacteroides fragilis TaxID=817 RepID=UPI0018A8FE3A|nr:hypothetical protein [Bacteroides fragilis]MCS3110741.1 hypothetical protein [Bacteroides fragilis]UVR52968.1 hypothetical protein NXX84_03840 [Bacteroides fragilis]